MAAKVFSAGDVVAIRTRSRGWGGELDLPERGIVKRVHKRGITIEVVRYGKTESIVTNDLWYVDAWTDEHGSLVAHYTAVRKLLEAAHALANDRTLLRDCASADEANAILAAAHPVIERMRGQRAAREEREKRERAERLAQNEARRAEEGRILGRTK